MGPEKSLIVWHDTLLLSEWYSLSRLSLAISSHPITNDISLFEVKEKGQDYYTSNPRFPLSLMKTEDGERVHIPKYGIEVKNSGVTSRKEAPFSIPSQR